MLCLPSLHFCAAFAVNRSQFYRKIKRFSFSSSQNSLSFYLYRINHVFHIHSHFHSYTLCAPRWTRYTSQMCMRQYAHLPLIFRFAFSNHLAIIDPDLIIIKSSSRFCFFIFFFKFLKNERHWTVLFLFFLFCCLYISFLDFFYYYSKRLQITNCQIRIFILFFTNAIINLLIFFFKCVFIQYKLYHIVLFYSFCFFLRAGIRINEYDIATPWSFQPPNGIELFHGVWFRQFFS